MEIWKDIPLEEWKYQASTFWNILSVKYWILKQENMQNWYKRVYISGKRIMVHRLVLITFVWVQEEGQEANHKNGIRHDNRPENLEWCTHSENCIHRSRELWKRKEQPKKRKPVDQFDMEWNLLKRWDSMEDVNIFFGKRIDVGRCCKWKAKSVYGFVWKFA